MDKRKNHNKKEMEEREEDVKQKRWKGKKLRVEERRNRGKWKT